jgi:hypothetical protein
MPELLLFGDQSDFVLVWTRMIFASDDEAAMSYFSALVAQNHDDLVSASYAKDFVEQLLNADSLADIESDAVNRIERGRNAGAVLHYVRKMVVRGEKEPSINKACQERDSVLQRSGRKYGESRVKRDWVAFRSVAHLWAVHTFVELSPPDEQVGASPIFDAIRDDLPHFLAVAELYRQFGESQSSSRQMRRRRTTLLDPKATWTVPENYPLPEVTFTVDT